MIFSDQPLWKHVKDYQLTLTPEESSVLVNELDRLKSSFISQVIRIPEVQAEICVLWQEWDIVPSKLAEDYNSFKKSNNQKIIKRINHHMQDFMAFYAQGNIEGAATSIEKVKFAPRYLINEEVAKILKSVEAEEPLKDYIKILKIQDLLIRSVLRMVADISGKLYSRYKVSNLEIDDLFQEGLGAALEATMRFDLKSQDREVKWSSFAYSWIYNTVVRFIIEGHEIIATPRHLASRYKFIRQAQKELGLNSSYEDLVEYLNAPPNDLNFTVEEVQQVVESVNRQYLRLDAPYGDNGSMSTFESFGHKEMSTQELIPCPSDLEGEFFKDQAFNKLEQLLSGLPKPVLLLVQLRWNIVSDHKFSVQKTLDMVKAETGYRFSASQAKELEASVRNYIKKSLNYEDFLEA